jgi:molybdenum cofactor biosynthesis enzyme MoaA
VNLPVAAWREAKSAAFDLPTNSTARGTVRVDFWGDVRDVYANANLSVYSAQRCNARCPFCVEELRPASRGGDLALQRRVEPDDGIWFDRLERVLAVVQRELRPSVSVTGGEPSKDPRLPRVLRTLDARSARKRTVTSNGSGLLDVREGQRVVDWIAATGVAHLNVSRAHPDQEVNARLMGYADGPTHGAMGAIVSAARAGGTRVRLSCVLLDGAIDGVDGVARYLDFARSLGVDSVIFRRLMLTDPSTVQRNHVVRFSDRRRVALDPLFRRLGDDPRFAFVRQIVGYYYYVEVWRSDGVDVVFEEADLARLEDVKRSAPRLVHELVFHPDGSLASTWQPWDGVLGPGRRHVSPPEPPAQTPAPGAGITGE